MRTSSMWRLLAAVALVTLTPSKAQSPRPRSALDVSLDAYVKGDESCDPSKWKLPVDGKYNTAGSIDSSKLNVHLIPHSHDDPGWLVSVDEYYMKSVQYILDTVVVELLANPDRKFMFVEQSFFQRWWHEQSKATKETVRQLVKEGRLDLSVNGGWCMHDEATTHYSAMVDQTAYGHALLKQEFNVTPRIGWQIDPFGHSSTQGSLLSAGVGFDALYFARMDYQDYDKRFNDSDLEFIWRPSKSRGKAMQVFTGKIIDHYGPPSQFAFDRATAIQDDPEIYDFNVCQEVEVFVNKTMMRGEHTKGNHIFLPMGDDFAYDNAHKWYKNMDKLIHYVNQDGRVNVLYSTLSHYTDLKLAEKLPWKVKQDDFFPYASNKHEYWSGYFTSRPTIKKFARVSNSLMQGMRQLGVLYQSDISGKLDKLQRSIGLVQHHDGITGTEKQAVADDYALRMDNGVLDAQQGFNDVFSIDDKNKKYEFCLERNVSTCRIMMHTEKVEVFVHNTMARKVVQTIVVPISRKDAKVTSLTGSVEPKSVNIYKNMLVHPETEKEAPYKIVFSAELEPLKSHHFLVQQFDGPMIDQADAENEEDQSDAEVVMENDYVRVTINSTSGSIVSLTNKKKKITIPLSLDVAYYRSYQGKDGLRSGAYLFRPDSKQVYPVTETPKADGFVTFSPVVMEKLEINDKSGSASRIGFKIGTWVTLEYILNDRDEFLEIEWTVGPIPIEDKQGKEVILRFDTQNAIQSASTLYTDSNGLEFVTRVRNHRDTWNLTLHDDQEFVPANYFPITSGVYMKDEKHQLNIVTDRAQGAASLSDGQIEVMVHRRLLMDDHKGVSESLNETETIFDRANKKHITKGLTARGTFFVNIDNAQDGMLSMRTEMEKTFFTPLVAFRKNVPAAVRSNDATANKLPWLTVSEFPVNVGLTSLVEVDKMVVMVRLSHLYSVGEHESLSKAASFDFASHFKASKASVSDVTELTLTGTAVAAESRGSKGLDWIVEGEADGDAYVSMPSPVRGTSVELQPMEVRTFRVTFSNTAGIDEARDVVSMMDFNYAAKEEALMDMIDHEEEATRSIERDFVVVSEEDTDDATEQMLELAEMVAVE